MTTAKPPLDIWARSEPDSPCTQVCVIHSGARICVGCYRTGDEIAAWSRLSYDERREIMATLPERAPMLTAKAARPSTRCAARKRE